MHERIDAAGACPFMADIAHQFFRQRLDPFNLTSGNIGLAQQTANTFAFIASPCGGDGMTAWGLG